MIVHWDAVWKHYRGSKELLPKDRIITKLVLPGHTLAWNSFGNRYTDWIPNLTVYEDLLNLHPTLSKKFSTILALNVHQLRYQSINEYADSLGELCKYLEPGGRLLFGVNSIFVNWNRTAFDVNSAFDKLSQRMLENHNMKLTKQALKPFVTNSLNGDCFMIFDQQKVE